MCGLTGFLGGRWQAGQPLAWLQNMTESIAHRGPDSAADWLDADAAIALGHRRLAIVDLSPAGAQPMVSASERYVIATNGEIYNHMDLRQDLGGSPWHGHSDTETLLAGFDAWGVEETLRRCNGMFAFALWDKHTRSLTLGRDRMGEKPMYYGWQGDGEGRTFLFGSELKALKAHPACKAIINRDALTLLLRHSAIPAPHSIYQGIFKLPPGSLLQVSLENTNPVIWTYWQADQVAREGVSKPFIGSDQQATDSLEKLLKDAVQSQMMGDVPLGAFLSGGVDSSTVVALMQSLAKQHGAAPTKTFTIGFQDPAYNEAGHALAVAQHLGTDHTELYVSAQQAMDVIPKLPHMYCEPFADSSQIPTYLVSQLARQHVTVSLSGDAGDELFAGYNRYLMASGLWTKLSVLPVGLRKFLARVLSALPPDRWNAVLKPFAAVLPASLQLANLGDKLHKAAGVLPSADVADLYHGLVSQWPDAGQMVVGGNEPPTLLTNNMPDLNGLSDVERMMALDMMTYLPDDILVKVDRAAMSVALETRVPFLDRRVVEFAWQLPMEYKLRDGQSKWLLRQVLYRHVPQALIERPKMGFGIPLDDWLRGPLRDWAGDLLSEARLQREGYFYPALIRKKWAEHLSGQRNWAQPLWCVLMFQAWLQENH